MGGRNAGQKKKALRPAPEALLHWESERCVFRLWLRRGRRCRRFGLRSAQTPEEVDACAPEDGELRLLRFLGLAVLARVVPTDELSVNEDMIAFVQRIGDGLANAVEGHDSVPLGFGLPLGRAAAFWEGPEGFKGTEKAEMRKRRTRELSQRRAQGWNREYIGERIGNS